MGDKKRWAREHAIEVAIEVLKGLEPACERAIVAGSVRRLKADVGDVEILFIPRFEERWEDMFTPVQWNLAEDAISSLMAQGVLSKRMSANGNFAYGPKNKLMLHRSGLPVDLFTATRENWWNYLVCRTGPGESNMKIAAEAQRRGWKWNPYGVGFFARGALAGSRDVHVVTSEREVFEFVGLPYREPWERV